MPHPVFPQATAALRRAVRSLLPLALVGAAALPQPGRAQTVIAAAAGNYNANTAGSYVLNAGDTRSNTGSTEVISLGAATGPFTLTIDGTVTQTGTGRGIRGSNNNVTFNLTVGSTGLVKAAAEDAIQARNGTFNLTNSGTIYSGPNFAATPSTAFATGQALDLANAVGGAVINNLAGVIRADGHDAVRLGSNMTFTNYGTIRGNGAVNDSPANNVFNSPAGSTTETYSASEGLSFENGTNSALSNFGSISGSRHGVETDVSATLITITNQSTGEMIGRNGSGIGSDATSASAANLTVHNYGLIRGDYAGVGNVIDRTGSASLTQDGDGDGVDIDGAATINNYGTGQIKSTGAGGFDSSGRANNSEALSIGGGIVVNDGLIQGATRGMLVNNDSVASRSGSAATTITNNATGTIEGLAGFALRLENKWGDARDNDTITNAGTITGNGTIPDPTATITIQSGATDTNSTGTLDGVSYTGTGVARFIRGDGAAVQMGEGNDTLTNSGTITGNTGRALSMEGGDDTVNLTGGTVTGSINGGAGTDALALGAGVSASSAIQNFETFSVASGRGTLSGEVSGAAVAKEGAGALVFAGANSYTGGTTVSTGTLLANNSTGSGTGTAAVMVNAGATLGGTGSLDGLVTVAGTAHLAPGDGVGTLTFAGGLTLLDGAAFDFQLGSTSDLLRVSGGTLTGAATGTLQLNFLNAGDFTAGTYNLINFTGASLVGLAATDFTFGAVISGYDYSLAINGSTLQLTASAVPEPSTSAVILGAVALVGGLWRRGRTRRTGANAAV